MNNYCNLSYEDKKFIDVRLNDSKLVNQFLKRQPNLTLLF